LSYISKTIYLLNIFCQTLSFGLSKTGTCLCIGTQASPFCSSSLARSFIFIHPEPLIP